MRLAEVVTTPTDVETAQLVAFVQSLADDNGDLPLSDHLALDLRSGGGDGFLAASVRDADTVLALAQVSRASHGSLLEVVTHPGPGTVGRDWGRSPHPSSADRARVAADAARTAIHAFRRRGGGRLSWWVDASDEDTTWTQTVAEEQHLTLDRQLLEMTRDLPHPNRSSITTRGFIVGRDEEALLTVNNRAFANHDEQGNWNRTSLTQRMSQPWFDPDGVRLYEHTGELVGFCWTKVHRSADSAGGGLAEIYVICVDPKFHGQGLGRDLTLAGLDWMSARSIATATLYVDAANTSATRLYDALGFRTCRTRAAYAGTLAASVDLDPT